MSNLKTKCLTLLDRVLRVTHFAKTTAEVFQPPSSSEWMVRWKTPSRFLKTSLLLRMRIGKCCG